MRGREQKLEKNKKDLEKQSAFIEKKEFGSRCRKLSEEWSEIKEKIRKMKESQQIKTKSYEFKVGVSMSSRLQGNFKIKCGDLLQKMKLNFINNCLTFRDSLVIAYDYYNGTCILVRDVLIIVSVIDIVFISHHTNYWISIKFNMNLL